MNIDELEKYALPEAVISFLMNKKENIEILIKDYKGTNLNNLFKEAMQRYDATRLSVNYIKLNTLDQISLDPISISTWEGYQKY